MVHCLVLIDACLLFIVLGFINVIVHCSVFVVQCSVFSVQCSVCSVQWSLCVARCLEFVVCLRVARVCLSAVCCSLCIGCWFFFAVHCVLRSAYCLLSVDCRCGRYRCRYQLLLIVY